VTGGPTVRVDGADVLARSLASAGRQLQDWAQVNAAAAARVAQVAARRAPKRSGRLAGSVAAQSDKSGATISASVVYAKVQEYGWAQRHIRAQPYLRPALNEQRDELVGLYDDRMKTVLSQVKGA